MFYWYILLEKKNDAKNRLKAKDILNYKILSYNNRNGDIKDMVLFNTMISNDPNLEEDFIKNKNYRDSENNSNLHIAVKNNSVELVKYFISKSECTTYKNYNIFFIFYAFYIFYIFFFIN